MTLSYEPRTGSSRPAPPDSSPDQVAQVLAAATGAARAVADAGPAERARWLESVADALQAHSDGLSAVADDETALGLPRLSGELGRAATALRFYGQVGVEGSWLGATIDTATDVRPDLRRVSAPLGPVAVFGASNFPFGFGVLGHDFGSAIAAGCPVVVKAHPAHPRLSAALAELAAAALGTAGAPPGTFGIVFGFDAGTALVTAPAIRAVAFTGSQAGGMALWRLAGTRERAIPVYAEMGTVNTAVVTRSAAAERADEIAAGYVASFTLGLGQFCTKPGLLLVPAGTGLPALVAAALDAAAPEGWLLTAGIAAAYAAGLGELVAAGARVLATTDPSGAGWAAAPSVLEVDAQALEPGSRLLGECFGPVALVAEYRDDEELRRALDALPGSLAAAVQSSAVEDPDVAELVDRLVQRAGRVVVNGWPTGVAVTWAQQHGGPWPATTDPSSTSVGAHALHRFVRPVAYQDVPDHALPAALRADNPWRVPRRVDGVPST